MNKRGSLLVARMAPLVVVAILGAAIALANPATATDDAEATIGRDLAGQLDAWVDQRLAEASSATPADLVTLPGWDSVEAVPVDAECVEAASEASRWAACALPTTPVAASSMAPTCVYTSILVSIPQNILFFTLGAGSGAMVWGCDGLPTICTVEIGRAHNAIMLPPEVGGVGASPSNACFAYAPPTPGFFVYSKTGSPATATVSGEALFQTGNGLYLVQAPGRGHTLN